MSTAFAFTFPRRLALSTGLRLIRWARRPQTRGWERTQTATNRRIAEVNRLARLEALAERRDRDRDLYFSQVRPFV